jgi:hypothetical protein
MANIVEKKNYIFLYRGLLVARDSLLKFVKSNLFATYGDDAWEKGVKRVFRAEDIERLEIQFNKRYSSPAGPVRPGEDLYEMLDINYFVNMTRLQEQRFRSE